MKTSASSIVMGRIYSSFVRDSVPAAQRRQILAEYRAILRRAKDIGPGNTLFASYAMAAYFIAMNRCRQADPEENFKIFARGYGRSRLLRASLGNADSYLSEKRMKKRFQWSAETHQRRYENDWVVDVLPACPQYDLGYDYTECGACKLCRDEGCPELAHFLCRLDFRTAELIGLRLTRTTTLADGGEKCDFRFKRP